MIDSAELADLRAEAERWMADECTITRPSTSHTIDPVTLVETPTAAGTVYDGKCSVTVSRAAQQLESGDRAVMAMSVRVLLPVTAAGIRPGDRVEVTTSADPDLVGRLFRVSEVERTSRSVHRVIQVDETQ